MYRTRPMSGHANWLGVWSLYRREVRRFGKIFGQTLLAPLVSTLLFLAIFAVVFGGNERLVKDVPFVEFLLPGLVMMAVIQNAFANSSSSLMMMKLNENIVDTLMPPLTAGEITLGFTLGAVTRGIAVGIVVTAGLALFVPLAFHNWGLIAFHMIGASLMLALLGLITSIWADKFDQVSTVTTFVVLPLTFLSGSFFSIERLPEMFQTATLFNPIFYAIDGFRYGFIGQSDGSIVVGVVVVVSVNLLLWGTCHVLIERGYKLKA